MKNVISVALLSLLFACSSVIGWAQTNSTPAVAKNDPPPSDSVRGAQKQYDSAMALSAAGRLDEAIEAFKESLKLNPWNPQTHFSMGMTYSKFKAYRDAYESFKKAVRYKPDWAEAHFRLGVMSYVLGKKSDSTEEYKKLLQIASPLAKVLDRIIKDEFSLSDVAQNAAAVDPLSVVTNSESNSSSKAAGQPALTNGSARDNSSASTSTSAPALETPSAAAPALAEIYRVGLGDVLDVRFLNSANVARSTLFTVVAGGVIDLPVAGGPIAVAGLTTDEIKSRIATELKRRAVADNAQISVGVRQFFSHSVMVNGLVAAPGARILRREAVPLYVVLSEAQLRNDAGRVVIMRGGTSGESLDLSDPLVLNTQVISGDIITVSGRPQEFYYIAGKINYPGQKNFQSGITLLQAILAAGGTRQNETIVEISRDGDEGHLVTTRFNLKQIKRGEVGDPKIQPGDRIVVLK